MRKHAQKVYFRPVTARVRGGVSAVALCAVAAAFAGSAHAQSAASAPNGGTDDLQEIVVTGLRASLRDALDQKRSTDVVSEAISAKDIGQLPDVTIAEALVRLPGLNGTRDRGNESQAVIRGLGPRLAFGTVDGREVASSEPDRNIRYEQYPSELLTGVQVYKAQSADLIAGGIAGTVNLQTIQPLDYTGPQFVGRFGAVYYGAAADLPSYSPVGYRGSATYVGKINDKVAFALGGTVQQQKNGYASIQGWGYNAGADAGDLNGDGIKDPTPWGAQTEVTRIDELRKGALGVIQMRPTDNLEIKVDAFYSQFHIVENQNQQWFQNWGNWDGTGTWYKSYTLQNGDVAAGTVGYNYLRNVIARYDQKNSVFNTGTNVKWTADKWTVTGDVSYSYANRDNVWNALYIDSTNPVDSTFDFRDGVTPTLSVVGNPLANSNLSVAQGNNTGPDHLRDSLGAGRLDVTRDLDSSVLKAFDFGLRIADRTKWYSAYNWTQTPTSTTIPSSMLSNFTVPGYTMPALLDGDFDSLVNKTLGGLNPNLATEDLSQKWHVNEKTQEGYAKLRYDTDLFGVPVSGNVGVRVIHVDTDSSAFQSVNGGPYTPVSVGNSYTEPLPSLNMNFQVAPDQTLRLGLSQAISRPPLDELRASRSLDTTGNTPTGSGGNPKLQPYKAKQIDLSYEWYFRPEALVAVAGYYKYLDSNVGYKTAVQDINGVPYQMISPFNGSGGFIRGAEFTFQTPFFFLPEPLQNFGIYSNYAYVNSNVHEYAPVNNPLAANGLARHTATVDLWYNHAGVEARLGYKYHSRFTTIYGWDATQLTTLEAESTLDFSAAYQLNDNIGFRFQVNNLTNEPLRLYFDNMPDRLARYEKYGQRYSFDVTFKY
ncbi:TonB-dependent receptor [Nitrospirillum amazonense]|uniref:TonB-dependent receptor n=1 Tax=Nitrospirillum amazonense TaxID=28077 RepID=A0A560KGH7_9PROT|nr:TonB-dependent receptor [Nitrospirillum amazonense]TWB82332.1 TonB-dependent receptor [Nitrospirillum amazonense]